MMILYNGVMHDSCLVVIILVNIFVGQFEDNGDGSHIIWHISLWDQMKVQIFIIQIYLNQITVICITNIKVNLIFNKPNKQW